MTHIDKTMVDLPPLAPPVKRSVTLDGHSTSVSLEDAFWTGLNDIAKHQGVTRVALIGQIDHARPAHVGLATALRLYVLAETQRGA